MFMTIWKLVLVMANKSSVKQFKCIPIDNLLPIVVNIIYWLKHLKSTGMRQCLKRVHFISDFVGEESLNYLAGFPKIILMLFDKTGDKIYQKTLVVIFV